MDIATNLLKAENVGKKQFEKFIAERVESNNVSFYALNQKKKNEIIHRTSSSEKSKG